MVVELYVPPEQLNPWRDERLFFSKLTVRPCISFAVKRLVVTLHYKPKGRWFNSRCRHWTFLL